MVYKYWDSITKEDLEFSVGTKQGHWDVKEPLVEPVDDYRTSVYDGPRGGRESVYDASSMDYQPQGHHYASQSRDQISPGYGNLIEGRQSYGDFRKQLGDYDDYDDLQHSTPRTHEREPAY